MSDVPDKVGVEAAESGAGPAADAPAAASAEAVGPTIWPAVLALGLTTMGGGLVADLSVWTSTVKLTLVIFGAAAFVLGLGGWVRLLRDEGRHAG